MKLIKNALIFTLATFLVYIFTLFILVKFEFGNGKLIYSVVDATSIKGGDTYRRFHEYEINKKYDLVIIDAFSTAFYELLYYNKLKYKRWLKCFYS